MKSSKSLADQTVRLLCAAICAILALSLAVTWFHIHRRGSTLDLVFPTFSVDEEMNPPTWFSSILLFFSSQLLGLIAWAKSRRRDSYYRHWAGLSLGFLVMSLDEVGSLHERLMEVINRAGLIPKVGLLYFTWVVPGVLAAGAVLAVYRPFLLALPAGLRRSFLLCGGLYLGGALGVESIEGAYLSAHGGALDGWYYLLTNVEEGAEMIAVALFIRSLMGLIERERLAAPWP